MTLPFQALSCPLDALPLQRVDACWRCPSGHSYDVSAQNYVNLLPVQHKRSRDPGDSKDMITARHRFLQAGHYLPIAQAVCRAALDGQNASASLSCLDAGCGEGYYLRALLAASEHHPLTLQSVGLDISKWAVAAAAKRDRQTTWVVGTNANLPVQPASLDLVLCMFGFPVYAEFARVLKPGGKLIQVDAGADHLRELREIIYPSLRPGREDAHGMPPLFRKAGTESLRYQMTVDSADTIADLLVMTPHFYRASSEGRARAAALTDLTTTVDVAVTQFTLEPNGTDHERI